MGPVAFMWPPDRPWADSHDNIRPCGSAAGVGERTVFPLTQGSVALSIADEAMHVAFRIAYGNNPTTQNAFADQVVNNITDIDPGHSCYKLNQLEGITAGTNATIQLEYWAEYEGENNGEHQSFFACSDITFVEAKDFHLQVPCFNVTSDDFNAPIPTPKAGYKDSNASTPPDSSDSSSGGLSGGAKAGIAIGAVVAGLLVIVGVALFLYRKGKLAGIRRRQAYEIRAQKLNAMQQGPSTASVQQV
ncbi:hypothetical protein M011DRAFT_492844 [Sporormia fimetaria CBS 119925]|uniref:Copper acquisition factor BIM1-like domain-containing protein n=1 Tax=Sporormia fimetaria CBS 119925 TaxID=1340428 RepID=A0A6A6VGU6_9PLEO|nr:hypothetical protein M011DRAFT_492844 [Sporormia fimetaria CBS 119925]